MTAIQRADEIQNVCAVGTGTMGVYTALCFALGGRKVALYSMRQSRASLDQAVKNSAYALEDLHQHGFIRESDVATTLALVTPTLSLNDAARDADIVMESIDENLEIKQRFFRQIDVMCLPNTIFATNTSSLDLDPIAAATSRPDKFIALHFFNAAHQNRVVEVAPTSQTSPGVLDMGCALMRALGRQPIKLDLAAPLFIVNKIQIDVLRTAIGMIESGEATAAEIDVAMEQAMESSKAGLRYLSILNPNDVDDNLSPLAGKIRKAAKRTGRDLHERNLATIAEIDKAIELTLGRRYSLAGPLRSADLGGWDIFEKIFQNDGDHGGIVPQLVADMVRRGDTGIKADNKRGMYDWSDVEASKAITDRRLHGMLKFLLDDWRADHDLPEEAPNRPIYRGAMDGVGRRMRGLAEPNGPGA